MGSLREVHPSFRLWDPHPSGDDPVAQAPPNPAAVSTDSPFGSPVMLDLLAERRSRS